MKTKIAIAAIALMAVTAPTAAADEDPVKTLAEASGLSERQVRMITGDRSAFGEYRISYDRAQRKLKAAIGKANYQRLMSGQPVQLPNGKEVQIHLASR